MNNENQKLVFHLYSLAVIGGPHEELLVLVLLVKRFDALM